MKLLFSLVLLFGFFYCSVLSCSCVDPATNLDKFLCNSEAAVQVKIIQGRPIPNRSFKTFRAKVIKVFTGSFEIGDSLLLRTPKSSEECGASLEIDQEIIVSGQVSVEGEIKSIEISSCTVLSLDQVSSDYYCPCQDQECPSPRPETPNTICDDGTMSGPICVKSLQDSKCGWKIVECPQECIFCPQVLQTCQEDCKVCASTPQTCLECAQATCCDFLKCGTLECEEGETLSQEEGCCPGRCVPTEEYVCRNTQCASGQKCKAQQVQCIRAPCPPIPVCV